MNNIKDMAKEEKGMPGMQNGGTDFSKYNVKYVKVSLDNPGDVAFLESLETKAISGKDDIMIMSHDKFTYESEYYIIVCYLEKKGQSSMGRPMPADDTDETTKQYKI